jgi:tRNA(Ile)-lysidine synthase
VLEQFLTFIIRNRLFNPKDKILLAVSGGVDSMVMTRLFTEGGFDAAIAHCNFGLRGKESDADEKLVNEVAALAGMEVFTKRFETKKYAKQNRMSTQMAARQLRYEWFEQIRLKNGFDFIATAHHNDDHIETILINMIRATGLRGLKGIPVKAGHIIRPLSGFSRSQIMKFAEIQNIPFREDASNAEDAYVRNKLRHHVIPVLKEINPGTGLPQVARIAGEAAELLEFFIDKECQNLVSPDKEGIRISISELLRYPTTGYLLYELLRPYGFLSAVVEDINENLQNQAGKLFYSQTHVCCKDRDALIVQPKQQVSTDFFSIEKDQDICKVPEWIFYFKEKPYNPQMTLPSNNFTVFLNMDKLQFPLKLRHPIPGDSFTPLGMKGKKKISDFLTDRKIPVIKKQKIWLLESKNQIVWVAGLQISNHFRVTEKTSHILEVIFSEI